MFLSYDKNNLYYKIKSIIHKVLGGCFMPRPKKCRKVCYMPVIRKFAPVEISKNSQEIEITIDEFETIRLIDKEGFSQEECSKYMNVARTTIQNIYNNARKKIAEALVLGKALNIKGGDYTICSKRELHSLCAECKAHNIE